MKVLVETSTFDADVEVPEDIVDNVTGATVETGFQALADRTKFLRDASDALDARLDALDAVGLPARLASDRFRYTTPKTRTVYVPLTSFRPEQSQFTFSGIGWISLANAGLLYCDLTPYIPAGATVANVTLTWKSGGTEAAGSTACQYKLERFLYDPSDVNNGTDTVPWLLQSTASYEGSPFGDDGHVQQIIKAPPTGCNPLNAIDTKAYMLLLTFRASDDGTGGTADIVYGVTVGLSSDTYVTSW